MNLRKIKIKAVAGGSQGIWEVCGGFPQLFTLEKDPQSNHDTFGECVELRYLAVSLNRGTPI